MVTPPHRDPALPAVDATLYYLDERPAEKPAFYLRRRLPSDQRKGPQLAPHGVSIHDARRLVEELSLDRQGVEIIVEHHDFDDFYHAEAVREIYYAAVERVVAEHVGARRVLAFDHNLRSQALAERGDYDAQPPVRFAHNDYTDASGPQRVQDLLNDEAETLLEGRFAVINVWRPIHRPVQATPLAVCDAQSLPEEHLVPMDLIYPERQGEIQSVCYDPRHRWLYFPDMQPEEWMLIKCFDSARDGRARFTAHSAFDHPETSPEAPARESIEIRTLAFF